MALARMKRIQIIGRRMHQEAVLQRLHELAFVEVETGLTPAEGWSPHQRKEKEVALEKEAAEISVALSMMERFHRQKPTFIQQFSGIKTMMTPSEYRNHLAQEEEAGEFLLHCRELESAWNKNETARQRIASRRADLIAWGNLDLPLSALGRGKRVVSLLVKLPVRSRVAFMQALEKIEGPMAYIEEISVVGAETHLFLLSRLEQESEILGVVADHQGALIELGEEDATVGEILTTLNQKERELQEELKDLERKIATATKKRPMLQAIYDEKMNQLERIRLGGELPSSEQTFLLDGWLMARDLSRLKRILHDISPTIYLAAEDPKSEERVPVEFENHPLIRPFEVVVQVYGYPKYGEIDPTPVMAPFFFIFFGLTLADIGYGLVLAGLCWYLLRTVKMAGMAKKLFSMLLLGGVASMVFGVLMSGFFADLITFPALWFSPTLDPIKLLIVSIIIGMVQLYAGILIKAYSRIKNGKFWEALREEGLWLFFLTSLGLLLVQGPLGLSKYAGVFTTIALVATIAVILSKMAGGGTFLQRLSRLPGGIFSLYDAVSFFSDLLSYSRLLALGLSSAIIGQVVNYFVRMTNPGLTNPLGLIAGFLIFAGGHLMNLLLGVLGSYVHSSRLQYIEFFNKFYDAGGRPFQPLALKYQYIELDEKGDA